MCTHAHTHLPTQFNNTPALAIQTKSAVSRYCSMFRPAAPMQPVEWWSKFKQMDEDLDEETRRELVAEYKESKEVRLLVSAEGECRVHDARHTTHDTRHTTSFIASTSLSLHTHTITASAHTPTT